MEIRKIISLIIELLGDQEGVQINYTLKEKEPEEKTA